MRADAENAGELWYRSGIEFMFGSAELEKFVTELDRRVTELALQYG